jgi:hypothetical protein
MQNNTLIGDDNNMILQELKENKNTNDTKAHQVTTNIDQNLGALNLEETKDPVNERMYTIINIRQNFGFDYCDDNVGSTTNYSVNNDVRKHLRELYQETMFKKRDLTSNRSISKIIYVHCEHKYLEIDKLVLFRLFDLKRE